MQNYAAEVTYSLQEVVIKEALVIEIQPHIQINKTYRDML